MSPGARASGQTLNTQLTLLHRVEGELRYRSLLSTLIWAGNNTDAEFFLQQLEVKKPPQGLLHPKQFLHEAFQTIENM